jgi:Protein of unknown function (DUF3228)
MAAGQPDIVLDEFAFRQFDDASYSGTRIRGMSKVEFMTKVLVYYEQRQTLELEFHDRPALVDGYAPFCKHLFVPNFVPDLREPVLEIDDRNEHLLRTKYEARTDTELPVLARYFPADKVAAPAAKYLDLILYSREQIIKERIAIGKNSGDIELSPWRLISVKAQGVPHETPMNPITIMRNALISEGGSGVPIDRDAYLSSVKYWSRHAIVS